MQQLMHALEQVVAALSHGKLDGPRHRAEQLEAMTAGGAFESMRQPSHGRPITLRKGALERRDALRHFDDERFHEFRHILVEQRRVERCA